MTCSVEGLPGTGDYTVCLPVCYVDLADGMCALVVCVPGFPARLVRFGKSAVGFSLGRVGPMVGSRCLMFGAIGPPQGLVDSLLCIVDSLGRVAVSPIGIPGALDSPVGGVMGAASTTVGPVGLTVRAVGNAFGVTCTVRGMDCLVIGHFSV